MSGELPKGWITATLPDLIGSDGVFIDGDWVESKDQDPNGNVRLIQLADVGDGRYVNKSQRFLTSAKAAELGCTYLQSGDVLIARMPDPLGRACIFPGDSKQSVTVVDVCIVRSGKGGVDHAWLMNAINSPVFRDLISSLSSGTTRNRVSRGNLGTITIEVPPLGEQRRIVAKLDALFERSRRAKASLDRIPAMLERLRQSILAAAFRGDLTKEWREAHPDVEPASVLLERIRAERRRKWEEDLRAKGKDLRKAKYEEPAPVDASELPALPEGWAWARLADVSAIQGGIQKQPSRTPKTNAFPFLRVANVHRGRLKLDEIHQIELFDGELEKLRLQQGDLLIVEGNGSASEIGRMAIWDGSVENCVHQNHIIRVRPDPALSPEFIEAFWNSPTGASQVAGTAVTTTGLYTLSVSKIGALPIPVAPEGEQIQLTNAIRAAFEVLRSFNARADAGRTQMASLERATLAKAFRGELVPQDPNDEPASELLKRIRAEREAGESKPARGRRRAAG